MTLTIALNAFFLQRTSRLVVCLTVLSCLCFASQSFGQTKLKEEEEVKVFVFRKWFDGTVVEVQKKDRYLLSYISAASGKEAKSAFARSQIRKLCEVDALDFCRTWKSSNGGFSVVAAVKIIEEDSVTLVKPDLQTLTVPMAKLGPTDRAYAKRLKSKIAAAIANGEVAAPTPALPTAETFLESASTSFGSKTLFGGGDEKGNTIGALPAYLKTFSQAGVGFKLTRPSQELVAVIPVGGPEEFVLISARDDKQDEVGKPFQSQLYWVSLRDKQVAGSVAITADHYATDYDPEHEMLLTFHRKSTSSSSDSERDYYTVWKLARGGESPEPIARWYGGEMGWSSDIYAKLVAGHVVVARTARKTYAAWDFVEKREIYNIKQESFFECPVTMGADRKHLIIPQDKNVVVINAETGEATFSFKVPNGSSGANINAAGTKLAAINRNSIYVWDLTSASRTPKVYPAPSVGSPFGGRIDWIDDDQILCESSRKRVLYGLPLKLPIWSYKINMSGSLNKNPLLNMVVGGIVFYVARPNWREATVAIGAVNLPGPSVAETIESIDNESLNALSPGIHIGLDVSGVSDPQKVEGWLKEKIKANQWVVDADAEIQMTATMGRGKPATQTYRIFGSRGGVSNKVTVRYTPYFANLKIKQANVVLWQSGSSSGAPGTLSGEPNTFQSKVTKMQVPQLDFFERATIASEVIHPKYSHGFGVSTLGMRGIFVTSTTPPGRADDPEKEASEDEAKRMNALEEARKSSTSADE